MADERAAIWFEGKVSANPSTLYMSGQRPVTILIRCTSDQAQAMNGKVAMLVFDPEQFDGTGASSV